MHHAGRRILCVSQHFIVSPVRARDWSIWTVSRLFYIGKTGKPWPRQTDWGVALDQRGNNSAERGSDLSLLRQTPRGADRVRSQRLDERPNCFRSETSR